MLLASLDCKWSIKQTEGLKKAATEKQIYALCSHKCNDCLSAAQPADVMVQCGWWLASTGWFEKLTRSSSSFLRSICPSSACVHSYLFRLTLDSVTSPGAWSERLLKGERIHQFANHAETKLRLSGWKYVDQTVKHVSCTRRVEWKTCTLFGLPCADWMEKALY